jgi:hypothetical protein
MEYRIVVAAFALSTIAFSAAAQQPSDQRPDKSGVLRLAQSKCPAVSITFPSHKISRDELDNKLPKNFKWDKDCVAKMVGLYNDALDELHGHFYSPKCDAKFTQLYFEQHIKEYRDLYDKNLKEVCRHPLR